MKANVGVFLILSACGGSPFTEGGSDPTIAAPVASSAASSVPAPAPSAAPSASASAPATAPPIGTSLAPDSAPDAGAPLGTTFSQAEAGAPDADTCDQSRANTHQNGFGGGWSDCVPAGTYSPPDVGLAEAIKACNSSPFSNGNTCRGATESCVPYATNIPQLSPTGNQAQYYWTVGAPPLAAGVDRSSANDNLFVSVPGPGPENCVFASPVGTWN
jgi:hypothetical protein